MTRTDLKGAAIVLAKTGGIIALIFGALTLGILAMAPKAKAQEFRCHYVTRSRPVYDSWSGTVTTHYYQIRQCHRNYRYYAPEERGPRVYGYRRRDDDDRDRFREPIHCRDRIRVAGDDKLDQKRAEISAQDRWALEAEVNFGTKFSDVRYAADIAMTCIRKVPSSITERGQAVLGVRHVVCSMDAKPCLAPKNQQDEESRAKRATERPAESTEPPPRDR